MEGGQVGGEADTTSSLHYRVHITRDLPRKYGGAGGWGGRGDGFQWAAGW